MPRVVLKGGTWHINEDEILKAAVMKYGKTQWTSIASLFHRKTAKQCKARWYEKLDPRINKTEWSRIEDEKLLHLAKLMPTQWRIIAPIIGRTVTQCLERYDYLLDQARERKILDDALNDLRKLKLDETGPKLETKKARVRPKYIDETELKMLLEARKCLASTEGKMLKKKEQKRRGRVIKGIDYNSEIQIEDRLAKRFFDIFDENIEELNSKFNRMCQHNLDGEHEQKLDQRKDGEMAMAMLQNQEPERNHSEAIQQIVKSGVETADTPHSC